MLTRLGSPESGVILAGQWRQLDAGDHDVVYAQHGPAPVDDGSLVRWLRRGCSGGVPVRQGFVAVLVAGEGSTLVAVSSRLEVAAYYAFDGPRLVIGTHARDLIRSLPSKPALNVQKLADLMALHDDRYTTVYKGVYRLPIGHTLWWHPRHSRPRVSRWFYPELAEKLSIHPAAAPSAMRIAIRGAVAASLPQTGDVAATLSGGLDSSMVVASAAAELQPQGRRIHTMTHVPLPGTPDPSPTWQADDGPYARQMVAEVPGLTWRPLINQDLSSPLATVQAAFDQTWLPFRNPANQTWIGQAVETAEQAGLPLLLTGATGNGPFSRGLEGLTEQMLARWDISGLARTVQARTRAGEPLAASLRPIVAALLGRSARPTGAPDAIETHVLTDQMSEGGVESLRRIAGPPATTSDDSWRRLLMRDASLGLNAQARSERVWWSDPLSDPEVVTLAMRLPPSAWAVRGQRGLAREAARGLVPDVIRLRQTRGSQSCDVMPTLAGREPAHWAIFERFRSSGTVRDFIDLHSLQASLARGIPQSFDGALQWEMTTGRALALMAFVLWYDESAIRDSDQAEPADVKRLRRERRR